MLLGAIEMPTFNYDNMQPSLALTDTIVLYGVYPSRDDPGGGGYITMGYGMTFASNFAPRNFADTSGQLLSIAQNTALFSILGTTYGGNGQTTFALPNLQGSTTIGNGAEWTLGGSYGNNKGSITDPYLPVELGGYDLPLDNMQSSLSSHYVINVNGVYPSGSLTEDSIGVIHRFYGNFDPGGTMACDGRVLNIADYPALFTLIGTIYGGDGITTFALPDLRGRTIVGDSDSTVIGEVIGSDTTDLDRANVGTGLLGSDIPFDNHQESLVMNAFVISAGIFPSRNQAPLNGDPQSTEGGDGEPYLSEILYFAGTQTSFNNAILTDGRLLSIASNTALFSLLGTNFGGDGRTTFAVPDLRGRTAIGSSSEYPVGTVVGSETVDPNINDLPGRTQDGGITGDLIIGGSGLDVFNGHAGDDVLHGQGGDDVLRGEGGTDALYGGDGNDLLNGGGGADMMVGGAGNDTYRVDDAADVVTEAADGGTDTVYSAVEEYILAANVEVLRMVGTIAATGNDGDNTIYGNTLDNTIEGGAGNDTLWGKYGDDTLSGGEGQDTLRGGNGADTLDGGNSDDIVSGGYGVDTLTGGAGADRFLFSTADLFAAGTLIDVITDFSQADGDIIDFTGLDGDSTAVGQQGFTFIGTAQFTGTAGEVRYGYMAANDWTVIRADLDGDGVADVNIRLHGQVELTASDFDLLTPS